MEGNEKKPWCAKVLQAGADADRRAVDNRRADCKGCGGHLLPRRPCFPSPGNASLPGTAATCTSRGWGFPLGDTGTWARRAPHPGCSGGKPRQPRPSSQHSTRLPASSLESQTMMGGDVPRASPADGRDGRETFCRSAGIFFTGFPRAHARRPACRRRELSVAACRSKDGDSSIQLAFSSGKN